MDYFRVNNYNSLNHIDIIICFVGNYLHATGQSLEELNSKADEYDNMKNIISKHEFNERKNNRLKIIFIDDNIYNDDSIRDIKEKIILALENNPLFEEIYLFTETFTHNDEEEVFNVLSNNTDRISNEKFEKYARNLVLNKSAKNTTYTFEEFKDCIFTKKSVRGYVPLGLKLVSDLYDPISVNPFSMLVTSDKRSIIEDNRLLNDYLPNTNIINMVIFKKEEETEYDEELIKLYYPMLTQYDLLKDEKKIKNSIHNNIGNNSINKFINIKKLCDSSNSKIIENINVQHINLFVKSTQKIVLPLERIFKEFKSSREIPLIKFNPGRKKEYVFRLFSESRTKENIRIPFVNKSIIRRYLQESRGKRNLYISLYLYANENVLLSLNIFENSDIEIIFESKGNKFSYNEAENFIKIHVNETLRNIETYTNFVDKFEFNKFTDFSHHSMKINNMNYTSEYKFDGNVKPLIKMIEKHSKDLEYVFRVIKLSAVDMLFEYSRVSVYDDKVPTIQISVNNKLLMLNISNINNIIYVDTILIFLTGLFNTLRDKTEIKISKVNVVEDIDKIVNNVNYFDKYDDVDGEEEGDNDDNDDNNELMEDENEDESKDEGDDEDEIDDDQSLGLSVHSHKSVFANNDNIEIDNDDKVDIHDSKTRNDDENDDESDDESDDKSDDESDDESDEESLGFSVTSNKSMFQENDDENDDENNVIGEDSDISKDNEADDNGKNKTNVNTDSSDEESIGLGEDSDASRFSGGGIKGDKKYYDYNQQRIKSYDPILFENNKKLEKDIKFNYKSYSSTCQTSEQRQPIVLTKEEKDNIDKNYPDTYGKHFLEYSSNPQNPYYYICPRYFCPEKNISLNEEHVFENKDGKIVSDHCKDDDGEYGIIIKADLQRQHRDKNDSSKYIYNRPGFGKSCIPCCFKQGSASTSDDTNKKVRADQLKKIENKEKKLLTIQPKCIENSATILSKQKEAKTDKMDSESGESSDEDENVQSNTRLLQLNYIKQFDKVPLEQNQFGEISNSMKQLLHIDKKDEKKYLRVGVEKNRNQSFIACLSLVYTFMSSKEDKNINKIISKIKNINTFKKQILKLIPIDKYIQLHNGDLNNMFYNDKKTINMKTVEKYSESKYYDKSNNNSFIKLVNSYENFVKYIKNSDSIINHTHLWEVATIILFENLYNLIIVEYDNTNDTIHLVCPINRYAYQMEKFLNSKSSIIILKHKEFYEPIFYYSKSSSFDEYEYSHRFNGSLNTFLNNISHLYRNNSFCGLRLSHEEGRIFYDNTSGFVHDTLKEHDIKILMQVVNTNYKNIGFIISKDQNTLYLPIYPSRVLDNIDNISIHSNTFDQYYETYTNTKNIFEDIFKKTNREIPCQITKKAINKDKIVGVYTLAGDYTKIVPEKNKTNDIIQDHIIVENDNNDTVLDQIEINKHIQTSKFENIDKINDMEKLLTNQELYNNFKQYVLYLLSKIENRTIFIELQKLINTYNVIYEEKYKQVKKIIQDASKPHVKFITKKQSLDQYLNDSRCEDCQTISIPKKHLLNESSNEHGFYNKLADELIRYKKMNNFFELPKQYINNNISTYNLHDDEILTFQSFIQPDNIDYEESDIKQFNDNYNLSYPLKSIEYSGEIFEDKILDGIERKGDVLLSTKF